MVGREILAILKADKRGKISKTGGATLIKIGFHAFHDNFYLHDFLGRFYFLTPMDHSSWSEGKFWPFLKADKRGKISKI